MSDEKSPPIFKRNSGAVEVGVWENVHDVDGEPTKFYATKLQRNYRGKDDKWAKTNQLRQQDLGDAIGLLQAAQLYLIGKTSRE